MAIGYHPRSHTTRRIPDEFTPVQSLVEERGENLLRKHAKGNASAIVAGAVGGLWGLLVNWPAVQWLLLSLVPSILTYTYAEELDQWKAGAYVFLSRVFWGLSGAVFILALVQLPAAIRTESPPYVVPLTAPQHRALEVLWDAGSRWGVTTMAVTADGNLYPDRAGAAQETPVVLGRELWGDGSDAAAARSIDLVRSIPDRYVRLIPFGMRFDVELVLQVTPEGARYLRESAR